VRYEKLARSYLGLLMLAAAVIVFRKIKRQNKLLVNEHVDLYGTVNVALQDATGFPVIASDAPVILPKGNII
jgi:hypothetical protein